MFKLVSEDRQRKSAVLQIVSKTDSSANRTYTHVYARDA